MGLTGGSSFTDGRQSSSPFISKLKPIFTLPVSSSKAPPITKTQPTIGGQKNPKFKHPSYQSSEVFYSMTEGATAATARG